MSNFLFSERKYRENTMKGKCKSCKARKNADCFGTGKCPDGINGPLIEVPKRKRGKRAKNGGK
jgi:hypothetical protein